MAKASAAPSAVLPRLVRTTSSNMLARRCAVASSSIIVHGMTTFALSLHSTTVTAMRPNGWFHTAFTTAGSRNARAIPCFCNRYSSESMLPETSISSTSAVPTCVGSALAGPIAHSVTAMAARKALHSAAIGHST